MKDIDICVFDAYGTLFDFNSAVARHRAAIGPKADQLSEMWRTKQIQYTWLRNSMGAYAPFWQVTGEALDHCLAATGIADPAVREKLLGAYLALDPFPEVPAMLDRLRAAGKRLAILSGCSSSRFRPYRRGTRARAFLWLRGRRCLPDRLPVHRHVYHWQDPGGVPGRRATAGRCGDKFEVIGEALKLARAADAAVLELVPETVQNRQHAQPDHSCLRGSGLCDPLGCDPE